MAGPDDTRGSSPVALVFRPPVRHHRMIGPRLFVLRPRRPFGERRMTDATRPLLLITLGDVAGVGPEIGARGWPALVALCRPVVVGDPGWISRGLEQAHAVADVPVVSSPAEAE